MTTTWKCDADGGPTVGIAMRDDNRQARRSAVREARAVLQRPTGVGRATYVILRSSRSATDSMERSV